METLPLKYVGYAVAFQEVPHETSLIFNISGCPYKCIGCHSQYLWEYTGKYISEEIDHILGQYKGFVTCVCFMGGDQNLAELRQLLIKCKSLEFKTCVYSGSNDKSIFKELLNVIDYLKIGEYVGELGGLNSKTTNQRFYQIKTNKERQLAFDDKTYLFWSK